MNKILITGPITDFGGRSVEVNIIAKSLESHYNVAILSTGYMTENSVALFNLKYKYFSTLDILLNQKYSIKFFTLLNYFKNKKKFKKHFYTNNKISNQFLNYKKKKEEVLINEILKYNLVILTIQLSSEFTELILNTCINNNIPVVIRTTGTIKSVPPFFYNLNLKKIKFIHHSIENANNLKALPIHNFDIIDQTSLFENSLLKIDHNIQANKLRYGYLGRLSSEKQIIELAHFFSKKEYPFIIAGDGILKNEVLNIIKSNKNCVFLGSLSSNKINTFFDKIDVLIITSTEETGPLVAIEALAAGKIIISTKVGAMHFRLDNSLNQFWIPIIDFEKDLNQNINFLENLDNQHLSTIANNNRHNYISNFSLKIIEEKYLNVITNFINNENRQ